MNINQLVNQVQQLLESAKFIQYNTIGILLLVLITIILFFSMIGLVSKLDKLNNRMNDLQKEIIEIKGMLQGGMNK